MLGDNLAAATINAPRLPSSPTYWSKVVYRPFEMQAKASRDEAGFRMMQLPDLRINYEPLDPDFLDRPVVSIAIETRQNDDELPMHTHRKGQLVVASRGSVMCRAPDGLWIVPPQGAVWIPGGVQHSNCVSSFGKIYCVFIDSRAMKLPSECCTFTISPLVRELIDRLASFPPLYPVGGPTSRLAQVLLDELVQMDSEQMYLPISRDIRLQQLATALLRDPGDRSTLDEWAERYAMSERTLARLIQKQTGLTFGRWRQRLHILIALQRLSVGISVQTVSQDLGYETPSAFITMFKKALGKSPRRYLADRKMSGTSTTP